MRRPELTAGRVKRLVRRLKKDMGTILFPVFVPRPVWHCSGYAGGLQKTRAIVTGACPGDANFCHDPGARADRCDASHFDPQPNKPLINATTWQEVNPVRGPEI